MTSIRICLPDRIGGLLGGDRDSESANLYFYNFFRICHPLGGPYLTPVVATMWRHIAMLEWRGTIPKAHPSTSRKRHSKASWVIVRTL